MNLKQIMKSKNIKQSELAKELGVSQETISDWCTGYRKPRIKYLPKLTKMLGISMEELVNIIILTE